MAAGNPVLYLQTPESDEVTRGCAIPFDADAAHLTRQMSRLLHDPHLRTSVGERARTMVAVEYSWHNVANQYEALSLELTGKSHTRSTPAENTSKHEAA
jgi:glycosyltransferase involved in cell wall biosynthesis